MAIGFIEGDLVLLELLGSTLAVLSMLFWTDCWASINLLHFRPRLRSVPGPLKHLPPPSAAFQILL
jgi:hypothetical protein